MNSDALKQNSGTRPAGRAIPLIKSQPVAEPSFTASQCHRVQSSGRAVWRNLAQPCATFADFLPYFEKRAVTENNRNNTFPRSLLPLVQPRAIRVACNSSKRKPERGCYFFGVLTLNFTEGRPALETTGLVLRRNRRRTRPAWSQTTSHATSSASSNDPITPRTSSIRDMGLFYDDAFVM